MSNEIQKQIIPSLSDSGRADQPPTYEVDVEKTAAESDSNSDAGTIDPVAERRLVLKQDLLILPALALAYLLVFIDRTNLGNAKVVALASPTTRHENMLSFLDLQAGLEKSLGLYTYDFNIGAAIYYIVYLFMEIPSALLIKRVGFRIVPVATFTFGVVTLATAFIENRGSFFAMRLLLGFTECFTMPANAYILTRYYRRHELAARIACFMVLAGGISQAFAGLLSSAFLSVAPIGVLQDQWRNIFLGEGIITLVLAVSMWIWYPNDPSKTRLFNEEERKLWLARFLVDQPAVVEHNEAISKMLIKRALLSPITIPIIALYCCNNMTFQGLSIFTTTILRSIYPARTTVEIQLYSVAPAVVGTVWALGMAYLAMRTKRYAYTVMFNISLGIIGYSLWIHYLDAPKTRYAALFLVQSGAFAYGPILLSWGAANASPDTIRAVTTASIVGLGSLGSIASTWSFINTDASTGYRIGNATNVAVGGCGLIVTFGLMMYMKYENNARAAGKRDDRLSKPHVELLGSSHPLYRYVW